MEKKYKCECGNDDKDNMTWESYTNRGSEYFCNECERFIEIEE